MINGQQYQIMSPGSMDGLMVGQVTQPNTQPSPQSVSTVQYTTSTNTGHGTVFIPAGAQQQVVTVQGATNGAGQVNHYCSGFQNIQCSPEKHSSLSGNLGLVPEKFLQKYGIRDTYDHQI